MLYGMAEWYVMKNTVKKVSWTYKKNEKKVKTWTVILPLHIRPSTVTVLTLPLPPPTRKICLLCFSVSDFAPYF